MNWKNIIACLGLVGVITSGCKSAEPVKAEDTKTPEMTAVAEEKAEQTPCTTEKTAEAPCSTEKVSELPCASSDTPNVTPPPLTMKEEKKPKTIWANSFLWMEAPKLEVNQWLSEKPETKGKYILLEFWNTWCPPCRRSLAKINKIQEKFGDELTVIALTDEPESKIKEMVTKYKNVEYPKTALAIDTKTKAAFGVRGVPHVVIIEPEQGCVVWEGFPFLDGYELTDEKIEKILAVGRKK